MPLPCPTPGTILFAVFSSAFPHFLLKELHMPTFPLHRFTSTALFMPALAEAHPGHGGLEGWAHWFTPEHVLPALIAVGVLLFVFGRRKDDGQ